MEVKKQAQMETKFKLYSVAELVALPPSEWLIKDVIETQALGVHFGPSGCGKSFAALDMAMSVATGRDWHGRRVKSGKVVYVIGEGTTGAAKRVKAWMRHSDVNDVQDAFFLLQAHR